MKVASIFVVLALIAVGASAYKVDVGTTTIATSPFVWSNTAKSWYAYHTAHRDSSNTPHEVELKDTMVVSLVQAQEKFYLAIINDIPNDGSGGNAKLRITCGGNPGDATFEDCRQALVNVVQHDDGHETLKETSAGSGVFTVSWGWAGCCTDGIMVGPFNTDNIDLYIQNYERSNLNGGLRIASQVGGDTAHTASFDIDSVVHIYGVLDSEVPVVECSDNENPAISWGDPHFTSFDGKRFDYQGRGAHLFCQAGGVEIQVCHEEHRPGRAASVNRAVAFNAGPDTVVAFFDVASNTHKLYVNDAPATFGCGEEHTFGDGSHAAWSDNCKFVQYTAVSGYRVVLTFRVRNVEIHFHAPGGVLSGSQGLCGLGDCDRSNDFTTSAGDVVTSINEFGQSWTLENALREPLFGSAFTCGPNTPPEEPPLEPICGNDPHPACDCCSDIVDEVLREACAFDTAIAYDDLVAGGVDAAAALAQVCSEIEIPTCDADCRGACIDGECVCATGSAPECFAPNEGFDCECQHASVHSDTTKASLVFVEGGVCNSN